MDGKYLITSPVFSCPGALQSHYMMFLITCRHLVVMEMKMVDFSDQGLFSFTGG